MRPFPDTFAARRTGGLSPPRRHAAVRLGCGAAHRSRRTLVGLAACADPLLATRPDTVVLASRPASGGGVVLGEANAHVRPVGGLALVWRGLGEVVVAVLLVHEADVVRRE